MMRIVFNKAKADPQRIVLAEGEHEKMIRAAHQLAEDALAHPILLGRPDHTSAAAARELQVDLSGVTLIDPHTAETRARYGQRLFSLRHRKGVTPTEAWELVADPTTSRPSWWSRATPTA